MNSREKTLAIAVAVLIGVFGLRAVHGRLNDAVSKKTNALQAAERSLNKAQTDVDDANYASELLHEWQAQSLPADREVARSLYYNWIIDTLTKSKLKGIDVTRVAAPGSSRSAYATITLDVKADGSLDTLSSFLFAFYEANFLHKIQSLDLEPNTAGSSIKINAKIQALILPGAIEQDSLPDGPSDRLVHDDYSAYRDSIVGRNLFAVYKPPPKPRPKETNVAATKPKPKPKFDDATQAFITGIVERNDAPELWINVRTTGEKLRLHEGEEFHIGLLEGRIVTLQLKSVVIAIDDEMFKVAVGKNLRQGEPIKEEKECEEL